jgi:adenine-specific DNA-methyltransferase
VVVAEFRDPIFPGLRSTGRVARGGIKPCQVVINGENFHALETILFAYEGKVDCIYIDPPYNTRDKDWKYNNNYVDSDDAYRHSKWLAMMERRLRLAKRLLNPERSVLIITIDEKEVHRLGLLLEQIFSGATIQMVTTLIKPSGSTRAAEFSRVEEYINFVMIGDAFPTSTSNDMLRNDGETAPEEKVTWHGLRRRGSTDWRRADRPNQFYPVFVDTKSRGIHSVGEAMPLEQDRASVSPPKGTFAAWPLAPNGAEGRSGRNAFNS